jgi:hypothetical protein
VLGAEHGDADREDEQREQAEQNQLHTEAAGLAREEERDKMMLAISAIDARDD